MSYLWPKLDKSLVQYSTSLHLQHWQPSFLCYLNHHFGAFAARERDDRLGLSFGEHLGISDESCGFAVSVPELFL
jgi:hypothetical protein